MDKYEYKVKLAQIEKLAAKKDYVTAAKIADGIDWRKVKSVTTLSLIADVYEATNRLEDCYEILNMVYDRSPVGRRVVYRLTEVATKMHDFEEAIDLYKEFVKIAPHDLSKYILKYQIYRERGSAVEDQIVILEEYKSHEYDERWSYELACLYEEAGMIDRCIEECDELILWFSEGEYVAKAMELKMKYQELTASQMEKYENRFAYLEQVEEAFYDEESEDDQEAAVIEKPMEENVSEVSQNVPVEEEDDTPKVSEINTNKFSTMNLQEELAKGLQQILAQAEEEALEEPAAEEKVETQEFVIAKEVVIPRAEITEEVAEAETAAVIEENADKVFEVEEAAEAEEIAKVEEIPVKETAEEVPSKKENLSETAELKTEILKYTTIAKEPKMEEMLRTEEDGQISLAIGEENILEKQITGQMTIEEILEAWEVKKRQAREKMEYAAEKRPAVLFETGEITSLLQDFIPRTTREVQLTQETCPKAEMMAQEPLFETEEAVDTIAEPEVSETEMMPEEFSAAEEMMSEVQEPDVEEIQEEASKDIQEDLKDEPLPIVETYVDELLEDDLPQDIEKAENDLVGQNTASMLDAIERALAMEIAPVETAGNYMTEEQEKIFAYFTSVNGMKKQLATLLNEEAAYTGREDSKEGNLIITGHPGNGKTTLAIDIVKAFQKQRREKGGKLAKVTGDGMNKKNPEDVVQKLGGGVLIIEHAGCLNDETVEKLSSAMEGPTCGLMVILEDASEEINVLLEKHERFALKFNRSVDIPIFSNDELVAFGKSYAEEQEYYFDEMAVLALYDSIGVRQTSDHVVNITEVKEFVDDAIAHAEKKSRGLFAKLSKKRIDEYGNRLLLEEDFDF